MTTKRQIRQLESREQALKWKRANALIISNASTMRKIGLQLSNIQETIRKLTNENTK